MNMQASPSTVTRELVPEDQRLVVVERLFGMAFPLQLEPVIYGITERMAEDYTGGYCHFYTLSNGGFYMAPDEDRIFHVICDNCFEGDAARHGHGLPLTPLLGCPAPPPGHAGMRLHLNRDSFLPKRRST